MADDDTQAIEHDDVASAARFTRALAGRLLRSSLDADDVAQEATVVSLERRPTSPELARGWLAGVVRNLVR